MNQREQNDPEVLLRERCLAYLLGDMTVEQTSVFESELDDPVVAAAMQCESNLLCSLATSDQLASLTKRASTSQEQDTRAPETTTLHAVVRFISALAAILVLALGYTLYSISFGPDSTPVATVVLNEDQLALAKHLVEPAIEWNDDAPSNFADASVGSAPEAFDEAEDPSSLDWIVAAVEASIQEESLRNEG